MGLAINLCSQQRVVVESATSDDTLPLWIYHLHGSQASDNILYGHLLNYGPFEEMGIAAGYANYQNLFWISGEAMAYPVKDMYGRRFGYAMVETAFYLYRYGKVSSAVVHAQRFHSDNFRTTVYRIRMPIITAQNFGIHIRVCYENQIGSYQSVQIQENDYNLERLNTTEIAVGPLMNFTRHLKFKLNEDDNNSLRRSAFFSARVNLVYYIARNYEASPNTYYGYPPALEEDSIQPHKFALRIQIDGRLKYLTQREWGFIWRIGVQRSAFGFGDRVYLYGGIGLYCGWDSRRKQFQEQNKQQNLILSN